MRYTSPFMLFFADIGSLQTHGMTFSGSPYSSPMIGPCKCPCLWIRQWETHSDSLERNLCIFSLKLQAPFNFYSENYKRNGIIFSIKGICESFQVDSLLLTIAVESIIILEGCFRFNPKCRFSKNRK